MRIGPTSDYNAIITQLRESKMTIIEEMDRHNAQVDAENEMHDADIKCFEISRRIIRGDIVPKEDHAFLQEHKPELYSVSILMRKNKENPEKVDRLSEEDSSEAEFAEDINVGLSDISMDLPISKLDIEV